MISKENFKYQEGRKSNRNGIKDYMSAFEFLKMLN